MHKSFFLKNKCQRFAQSLVMLTCAAILNHLKQPAYGINVDERLFSKVFRQIDVVTQENFSTYIQDPKTLASDIKTLCDAVHKQYKRYGWKQAPCSNVRWQAKLHSKKGAPLIYATFGEGNDTTLFLGGVHPHELTPIHLAFKFADFLNKPQNWQKFKGQRVIVAPLVNPDGFLRRSTLRTNGLVDVNRNFLTSDWYEKAHKAWQKRGSHPRYFPGHLPNSEIETLFQIQLIDEFKPQKILSVHAPLGFYDYDGPGDQKPKHLTKREKKARHFVYSISKKTNNYRVVDYSFYPGSLGNFSGNERKLPTITLELKTTNPSHAALYWEKFRPGLEHSISYPFLKSDDSKSVAKPRFFDWYEKSTH